MNKKILISGSSGFVGSNVQKYFSEKGYTIFTLNRSNTSDANSFTWQDINNIPPVDIFIHLSGKAHDTSKTQESNDYFEVNTKLTKEIYTVFTKNNATAFIYFSSVKAIADTVESELTEETIPNPSTPYGKSKLAAEEYILQHAIKKSIILRPCMIHGMGNKGNLSLLYNFVKKKWPIPLGGFNNSRSFLCVENLLYILEQIIQKPIPNGAYNLADDEPLSTIDVLNSMYKQQNMKSKVIYFPKSIIRLIAKVGNFIPIYIDEEKLKKLTENYVVSNEKIKKALQIQKLPLTTIEGIRRTIQYLA